jgi:hypothetical protein
MSLQHHSGEREQAATRSNAANISQNGIQRKAVDPLMKKAVQRAELPEEELPVQQQAMPEEELPVQQQAIEEELPMQAKAPAQLKANNTGLPDQLKAGVEATSGLDMSDVKVHYNSSQPAQLNAYAYAQGTDIHIGPGQEQHLPHEAWHVVQQKQGRVEPTMQLKDSVPVNDDVSLEHEADVMGQKSMQFNG